MPRLLLIFLLALAAALGRPAAAADVPARPVPFTFVTDQANLLKPAEAKKLESGLRRYADNTGTQVVVVTVPSLGGTEVADYARQLGTAWGVGQRGKNNGIVVLLAGKEHQLSIQAGSGLRDAITPEVKSRVISQDMTPAFKQGDYFGGLRKGLSSLMQAANPSSSPNTNSTAAAPSRTAPTEAMTTPTPSANLSDGATAPGSSYPAAEQPASSGIGLGTILIGVLVIGGGIWLVSKLFRRNNNSAAASQTPNFMGNRPSGPTPNFGAPNAGGYPQNPGYQNPGYGPAPSGGSGMGGILATGAAAAAGAYLGNRLSQHGDAGSAAHNFDNSTGSNLGNGVAPAAGAGTAAADDYFSSRGGGDSSPAPDYFSDTADSDNSGDYFSTDNSSYDDTSSDDTGGGGFDSTDDSNGSW